MGHFVKSVTAISVTLSLAACVAEVAPPRATVVVRPVEVYVPPPPRAVVSVYVEPPLSEPEPIAVGWAPPPLLVESPPPPPFDAAVWVGGYWVWQGDWVWAHGHWVGAPRPDYVWVHPYYEHRDGVVLFITGHWSPPNVVFVPPPPGIHLTVEIAAAGVVPGPRPLGPNGCFIPPPPGSRPGIIIPAPIGTAPAVMTGAPPVVAVGMRVTNNVNSTSVVRNNTVVNNTTNNVTNVRNVTNITNVTIVAPPGATASGQAVNTSVPAQAHLAAAQAPVVKAQAPEPASQKPIPAFVHGRPPAALPPAQQVNTVASKPQQASTNAQHPNASGHGGPAANGGAAAAGTPTMAKNGNPSQADKKAQNTEVAKANERAAMDGSRPNSAGHPGELTAQPRQDKAGPMGANQNQSGSPHPQFAATNARGEPAVPAKQPNGPKPSPRPKEAQSTPKSKGEHPNKPAGKDAKQDQQKAG